MAPHTPTVFETCSASRTRPAVLAAAGTDVATIGRILGHRPGSVVMLRYLHTDDERLRQAAEAVAAAVGGV